jgi:hypothetical protein
MNREGCYGEWDRECMSRGWRGKEIEIKKGREICMR